VPDITCEVISRKRLPDGEQVTLKLSKIKIALSLEITMWLPENASKDAIEHEKGHASICLDNYRHAEKLAKELATPFVEKQIVARGPDRRTTVREVLMQVRQEIGRKYREETVDKANITSGLFDRMTINDHAAANVNQKVADAELEYARLWPTMKAKRNEEERLLKQQRERGTKDANSKPSAVGASSSP